MKNKNLIIPFIVSTTGLFLLAGCGGGGDASTDAADAASDSAASGGMVLFQPEFPPEQIEGTPEEGDVRNLVPVPREPPSLRLPAAATLVSLNKPVTASDDFPIIGELSYITDGYTRAGEGFYVELMPGPQWVQIDLEEEHEIHGIWVWHYHRQARAYHNVVVQISNDENFQNNVTTVFNNDYSNSLGLGRGRERPYLESRFGKPISVDGVKGRFVRLHSAGNTANEMNHYIEVEVYGMPVSGS